MPKLITTNLAINNGGHNGNGHGNVESRYERFAEHCLLARPDIVVVQEASCDYGLPALQGLAKALGHDYFSFSAIYPGQEDDQGAVVSSNIKITGTEEFEPELHSNRFQIVDFDNDGQWLQLVNVHMECHLLADYTRRRKLLTLIRDGLEPDTPQILAGDFNAIPRLPSIKFLKTRYRSAHETVHGREPYTYPTELGDELLHNGDATARQRQFMRLGAKFQKPENRRANGFPNLVSDYVFVSDVIQVDGAELTGSEKIELAHSDHRGLEIDFRL